MRFRTHIRSGLLILLETEQISHFDTADSYSATVWFMLSADQRDGCLAKEKEGFDSISLMATPTTRTG